MEVGLFFASDIDLQGAGLCKCFTMLIQPGYLHFLASHTGIDLSNKPTEGGHILMERGSLNSRASIDWPSLLSPNGVPDTHFNEGTNAVLPPSHTTTNSFG